MSADVGPSSKLLLLRSVEEGAEFRLGFPVWLIDVANREWVDGAGGESKYGSGTSKLASGRLGNPADIEGMLFWDNSIGVKVGVTRDADFEGG